MTKHRFPWIAGLLLALTCRLAVAQLAEADTRLAGVAPFINERTVALVHVDLSRIDLKGGYDRVEKQWDIPADTSLQVRDTLKVVESVRKQLVDGGAKDIYVVVSSAPLGALPPAFVVMPVAQGKDPADVIDVLKTIPGIQDEPYVQKGAVVLSFDSAMPGTKAYVTGIKPAKRPEFGAGLTSAGATDVQVVFVANKELLDALKGAGDQGAAAADKIEGQMDLVKWLAVSVNLPPKPAFALITNWRDDETAKTMLAGLQGLLDHPAVKDVKQDPVAAKAIDALMPKQQGSQLRIVLTEANGGIQAVADGIRANLGKALEAAKNAGGLPGLGK